MPACGAVGAVDSCPPTPRQHQQPKKPSPRLGPRHKRVAVGLGVGQRGLERPVRPRVEHKEGPEGGREGVVGQAGGVAVELGMVEPGGGAGGGDLRSEQASALCCERKRGREEPNPPERPVSRGKRPHLPHLPRHILLLILLLACSAFSSTKTPTGSAPFSLAAAAISAARWPETARLAPGHMIMPT